MPRPTVILSPLVTIFRPARRPAVGRRDRPPRPPVILRPLLVVAFLMLPSPGPLDAAPELPLHFEHLSLNEGLSQSTVFCITQDRHGFLWMGTEDGLNRYDGYRFEVYRHERSDPESLSNNIVKSVWSDRSGVLWIGTGGGGLNRWDQKRQRFRRYQHDPDDPNSLSHNAVEVIYEDHAGVLWIGTYGGGLNALDPTREKFTRYVHDPDRTHSLSSNIIMALREDEAGVLWIGTGDGGVDALDRNRNAFTHYLNDPADAHSVGSNRIMTLGEDHRGRLWIGTENAGISVLDRERTKFIHYRHDPEDPHSLSDNNIRVIFTDRLGTLWIGTFGGGLNVFDPERRRFIRHQKIPTDPDSLNSNSIYAMHEDPSNILWIGTYEGGLNKLDQKRKGFIHFKHDPHDPNSLSHNSVKSFVEDHRGAFWIGTEDGLNRFDRETGRFLRFRHDPTDPHSVTDNYIRVVYEDRSGVLWIGTWEGGLDRFDRETRRFVHYRHEAGNPSTLSEDTVISIYEDRFGVLWIGTDGEGLNRFNRSDETFMHFKHEPGNPKSLSNDFPKVIYEDGTGTLWIGTFGGGLSQFHRETATFTRYQREAGNAASLSDDYVMSIHEDHAGALWIGTSDGLNRLDRQEQRFTRFGMRDGLPNDIIYGISEDDDGNLWLSTNKGLAKFRVGRGDFPARPRSVNYDVHDGLQSNEFNGGACYKTENGVMYFGGVGGFNVFHPDHIQDNPHVPPVVLTDFKIFNESVAIAGKDGDAAVRPGKIVLPKHISEVDALTLSYRDAVISFEFAALDFSVPRKNRYAYLLEGFDTEWTYSGSRRFVTYTNLDPGEYTFRVKASNNDGVWNEEGTAIRLRIIPPIWRTWWFRSLGGLAALSVILLAYTTRVVRIKNQKKDLEIEVARRTRDLEQRNRELELSRRRLAEAKDAAEAADRAKSEFLATMSHEIRTPMNGVIGMADLLQATELNADQQEYVETIRISGQTLLRIINDILDFSKIESGRIDLEHEPFELRTCMEEALNMTASLASAQGIRVSWSVDARIPAIVVGDVTRLRQVLVNLLNNALKFSHGGEVSVAVTRRERQGESAGSHDALTIEFAVEDSGIGIPADRLDRLFKPFSQVDSSTTRRYGGTGLGLAICKRLVELMGGEIRVESEVGRGTTVFFTLPTRAAEEIGQRRRHKPGTTAVPEKMRADRLPLQILVAEDNLLNQKIALLMLQQLGYVADLAMTGKEVLESLKKKTYHLVLMDLQMPEMDGLEATRQILEQWDGERRPKIIAMTANAMHGERERCLAAGMDDYLAKPISQEELGRVIARWGRPG